MSLLRLASLLLLGTTVQAGLIEQAERVVLPNGLEVILIHHPANPVVGITTIVRAGVRNETADSSGASHFLEHLLFNGTTTRTQKQLYDETDFYGIYNNAQTRADFTLFMMLAGSEHVEKALSIQSDMLFHSTLPEEKFDKERNIVLEEMARYAHGDNTGVQTFHRETVFAGTPYSRPVLGTIESLKEISRDAAWNYYKQQYVPKNMTLMVMGDFDKESLLTAIKKEYGAVTQDTVPPSPRIERPKFTDRKLIVRKNEQLKGSYLNVSFAGPMPGDAEFAAVAALTTSISDRLQKTHGSNGVQQVSLGIDYNRDFSTISLSAHLDGTKDSLAVARKLISDVKNQRSHKVSAEQLRTMLSGLASDEIFLSEKVHYYTFQKAGALATGGLDFLKGYLPALEGVSTTALPEIARRYLTDAGFTGTLTGPSVETAEITDFQQHDIIPAGPTPVAPKIRFLRKVIPGGMTVIIRHNPGSRVCGIHVLARNRCYAEPRGKDGIIDLMHQLLPKGTHHRDANAFQRELANISGTLKVTDSRYIPFDDYYFSKEYSYIRLETLDKHMDRAVLLLTDAIRYPSFDEKEFETLKGRIVSSLESKKKNVRLAAKEALHARLFGKHPITRPITGTVDSVRSIKRTDVLKLHKKYFAAGNLIFTVATGLQPDVVLATIEQTFQGAEGSSIAAKSRQTKKSSKPEIVKLKSTGAAQAQIYFGHRVAVSKEDRPAAGLMASILSDRLVFQLREREGLAYSLGCSFGFTNAGDYFAAGIGTRPENTDKAIEGIRREIVKFLNTDITQEEVDRVRNSIVHRRRMRRLTSVNQAYFMGLDEFRGLGLDGEERLTSRLKQLTPKDLVDASRKYLKPHEAVVIVAD